MPATNRQQQTAEAAFRRDLIKIAFAQCLAEFGMKRANGCTHLVVDLVDALLAELRNSQRGVQ